MDAKDLQEIVGKVAEAALNNPQFMALYHGVSRVLSYLVSEQDKRKALQDAMEKLNEIIAESEKERIITNERLKQMQERNERNGRLLVGVITALLGSIGIQALRLIFK